MEIKKPSKPEPSSSELSLKDLIGDEESLMEDMVEGEEEGEDSDLGFFTEAEAVKKLEALGYKLTAPEAKPGQTPDEYGKDAEVSMPQSILGSN